MQYPKVERKHELSEYLVANRLVFINRFRTYHLFNIADLFIRFLDELDKFIHKQIYTALYNFKGTSEYKKIMTDSKAEYLVKASQVISSSSEVFIAPIVNIVGAYLV